MERLDKPGAAEFPRRTRYSASEWPFSPLPNGERCGYAFFSCSRLISPSIPEVRVICSNSLR